VNGQDCHGHGTHVVANMSLGGYGGATIGQAVRNFITSGVTYAIAAGNDNYDACYYSPARVTEAITVGALSKYDYRAWFSNYGSCGHRDRVEQLLLLELRVTRGRRRRQSTTPDRLRLSAFHKLRLFCAGAVLIALTRLRQVARWSRHPHKASMIRERNANACAAFRRRPSNTTRSSPDDAHSASS
jgi:hypothetical protein